MPPIRNVPAVYRSRRISLQAPKCYNEDSDVEDPDFTLRYPSESASTSTSIESDSPPPAPVSTSLPVNCDTPYLVHASKEQLGFSSSRSRGRAENHIPRPPNAFICFRSAYWIAQKDHPFETDHRQVSRSAGRVWKHLTSAQREPWAKMARDLKKQHSEKFPNYKYTPGGLRRGSAKKKRSKEEERADIERCEELAMRLINGESLGDVEEERKYDVGSGEEIQAEYVFARSLSPEPKVEVEDDVLPPACSRNSSPVLVKSSPSSDSYGLDATPKPSFCLDATLVSDETEDNTDGKFLDSQLQEALAFVPTNDIPSIDAEMSTLKISTNLFEKFPTPPSFLRIDSQFGFKPQIRTLDAVPGLYATHASNFGSESHTSSLSTTTILADSSTDPYHLTDLPPLPVPIPCDEESEQDAPLFDGYTISGAYRSRNRCDNKISEPPISPRSVPITGSKGENMWDYISIPE